MSGTSGHILEAHFAYRGEVFFLRVVQRAPVIFAFTCPVCGVELRLDPRTHHLIVNHMTKKIRIEPDVQCRPECGWYVTIVNGVATDVDPAPAPEPPWSEDEKRICPQCLGEFNSGAVKREKCFDCDPYELHPGARAKRRNRK